MSRRILLNLLRGSAVGQLWPPPAEWPVVQCWWQAEVAIGELIGERPLPDLR